MKNTIRNNTESMLLRRVAQVSQKVVAEAVGNDTSTISRVFSGQAGVHIDEMEDFFNAMGLRLIECEGDTVTLPKAEYEALRILARKGV